MTQVRPNYYKITVKGVEIQPFDLIKALWSATDPWVTFCLGNTLKYLFRAGRKDPATTVEDLKKAKTYIEQALQHLESSSTKPAETSPVPVPDYSCSGCGEEAHPNIPCSYLTANKNKSCPNCNRKLAKCECK